MEFKSLADAVKAVKELRKGKTGKMMHYPVMFKLALMTLMEKQNLSAQIVASKLEIASSSIFNWKIQYEEGLYSMEGAYSVSKKSQSLNGKILTALKQKAVDLAEKIKVVEAAEKLGLKVTDA